MKEKNESQATELAAAVKKTEDQAVDIASFNEKRKAIIKDANDKIKKLQEKIKEVTADRDALKAQLETGSNKTTEVSQ